MLKVQSLKEGYAPLSSLTRWDANYRKGDVDHLVSLFRRFGYRGVICIREGIVFAGNHSLIALELIKSSVFKNKKGWVIPKGIYELTDAEGNVVDWQVPVADLSDLSILEAKAFAAAHNHSTDYGENDNERLAALLVEIKDADESLAAATGYSDDDVLRLLGETLESDDDSDDEGDEPQEYGAMDNETDQPGLPTPPNKKDDSAKYPLAIVISAQEYRKWQEDKESLHIKSDTEMWRYLRKAQQDGR